jgi:DNA-binding NarL/FixJ family response regulator
MAAVAIYSADPKMRDRLGTQLRAAPAIAIVDMVDDMQALARVVERSHVDAVLADAPSHEQLNDWHLRHPGVPIIVLVDGADAEDALDALYAGGAAILPRSADRAEIVAAIAAAINGLATLPRDVLETLLDPRAPDAGEPLPVEMGAMPSLTPRELEVLAAMADGASNKAIARRLGISFHTAKFHVAAILAKLDADSRTEAVTKAAHLGLVML